MTALLILASTLAIGLGFVGLIQSFLLSQQRSQLVSHARSLQNYASLTFPWNPGGYFSRVQFQDFYNTIGLVANVSGTHIILTDIHGNIWTQTGAAVGEDRVIHPDIIKISLENYQNSTELFMFSGTMGEYYATRQITAVIPVRNEHNQIIMFFYLSMPANNYNELMFAFVRIFVLVSLFVVLIAAFSAYLLSRRTNRPLCQMRDAVIGFSLGDFTKRIPLDNVRHDEIGELAVAFNGMADSLAKIEELRRGFIANISHEMRTPMTNVLGYIDGIIDGTLPDNKRYLAVIRDEILRLSRLVGKTLDIAKLQSGEYSVNPQPFDLCELVSRVLFSFERKIEQKKLEVRLQFEDGTRCCADSDAVTQVCFNLLDNAIKFSDDGQPLDISINTKNGKVWFSVTNFGPDIPAEDLPYVFDRFHKADHSRAQDPGGLGLGLYLVKTIINTHGEQVFAASENGVTTFSFSLSGCK
jgi:signal transduction histidine kinase